MKKKEFEDLESKESWPCIFDEEYKKECVFHQKDSSQSDQNLDDKIKN